MNIIDEYAECYGVPRAEVAQWCDDLNASLLSCDRARIAGDTERFKSIGLRPHDQQITALCLARRAEVG